VNNWNIEGLHKNLEVENVENFLVEKKK
jgi:hypothetical protein